MSNSFKFGRTYKKVVIDTELSGVNLGITQEMFQLLARQRVREREDADARQRESIERYHQELIAVERERAYQIRVRQLEERLEMEREREQAREREYVEWGQLEHEQRIELMNQHKGNSSFRFW